MKRLLSEREESPPAMTSKWGDLNNRRKEIRKICKVFQFDPFSIARNLRTGTGTNETVCQRPGETQDNERRDDTVVSSEDRGLVANDCRNNVGQEATANVNAVEVAQTLRLGGKSSRNGDQSTPFSTFSSTTISERPVVDNFEDTPSTMVEEVDNYASAIDSENNDSRTNSSNEEDIAEESTLEDVADSSDDSVNSSGSEYGISGDDSDGHETFSITGQLEKLFSVVQFKNSVTNLFIILVVLAMAVRSKLNYITILSMFRVCKAMTVNCELPLTKKTLWKLLSRNDDAMSKRHWYCGQCFTGIEVNGTEPTSICSCQRCGPNKTNKHLSYFIQLEIKSQVQQLFENRAIFHCLSYRSKREKQDPNNVEDICDGKMYKKLCEPGGFLHNGRNYSFSFFTDGVKISNSSNASAWPIMLIINEFSPQARKRYMILAGIWVDQKHPDLQFLLWPIVKELKLLYTDGIEWTNPVTNEKTLSKFVTLVCTADSKARAPILFMTQGNGEYGCTYCYHKGVALPSRGVVRVYPHEEVPSARRTHKDMYEQMMIADSNNKIFGIQGSAAIALLPEFDLSRGAPVDSMHNVYLGVAKFHTQLILNGKASDDWYIGSPRNIATINEILLKIRPPSRISRRPRPIEENAQWKASEWKNWIQFYAIRCLHGILGQRYHAHLTLLSRAVYILNKSSISTDELKCARKMLKNYVKEFEELFGQSNMRFNIHLLNHLADSVEDWGPFWAHSAFPYEAYNKKIVDKVTSANSRCLQIATRHLLTRFIENSLVDERIPYNTREKVNEILTNGLKKRDYATELVRSQRQIFEGMGRIRDRAPLNVELEVLRAAVGIDALPESVTNYRKAIIFCNGVMTYSCESTESSKITKHCDKYIHAKTIGYGEIKKILTFRYVDGTVTNGFVVKKLMSRGKYNGMGHVDIVTEETDAFVVCDEKASIMPAIVIAIINEGMLISKLPNVWETD